MHGQYRRLRSVTAVAFFALAGQARALGLGEPVVASAPGQPLDGAEHRRFVKDARALVRQLEDASPF